MGIHDGFIIAAGNTNEGADYDFALARYDGNGNPDGSFGSGGIVTTDFGGDNGARALAIKSGKVITAGESTARGTDDFALARYSLGS